MDKLNNKGISRRLIVVFPDYMLGKNDLAQEVYWMAEREELSVLYLVLVDETNNMLSVSRNMATMKAVTSGNKLLVEGKIVEFSNWFDILKQTANPTDIILCQEEQTIIDDSFKTIPIKDYLSNHLTSPVRTISGYYLSKKTRQEKWFPETFAWFGFLIILAVFTWMQISLDQALEGSLSTITLAFTVLVEGGVIWYWYKFSYQ